MLRKISLCIAAVVATACATQAPEKQPEPAAPPTAQERAFAIFAYTLEGTYDTIPQAAGHGDSSPVRMRVTKPWPDGRDEAWRHIEYSTPGGDGKPFLERLYRFRVGADGIVGTEFELPGGPLAGLKPGSLKARPGCDLRVQKQMESLYAGGTLGEACPGEGAGAARRHFDFYLSSSSIRAWERGYDRAGRQVTGPKGPWEFRKTSQNPR